MVRWFSPGLLFRVLVRVVVARLAGEYADRRERLAALPADGPYDYSSMPDELWLDYVADLGDGFASTATVASLIAADKLAIDGEILPHGRVLVMGGDQVYPAASREDYRDRLEVPYYSVHPESPASSPRDLFVLPGNHDWYDGLATFSRLFMQQRWFAGWRTRQSRSYFVLRLPRQWWLIAVDLQLDNDIDRAQRDYLLNATRDVAPGDRVVLATAVPFWLEEGNEVVSRNVAWLERILVHDRGAQLRVTLAGDLHHYQRHEQADGAQHVVSGGGGAFMHGTAWQPAACRVGKTTATRRVQFPTAAQSRLALWRLLVFPLMNPGFALMLGVLLVLLGWGADAVSHGVFFSRLGEGSGIATSVFLASISDSPLLFLVVVGWLLAFVQFTEVPGNWPTSFRGPVRLAAGSLVGVLLLLVGIAAFALVQPSRLSDALIFPFSLAATALLASLLAGATFGAWLFASYQLAGFHRESVFAACRIADYKNFLRIRIATDGTLVIHAIGIERICRRWRERTPAARGEARVEPADGVPVAQRARIIDKVVVS